MTPRLVVRPQAQVEIHETWAWYEEQSPGLGSRFIEALDRALARIVEHPLAHPRVHGEIRRALLDRFPHGLYFRPLPGEIVVLAVVHGRRHPRHWRSRR